MSKNALCQNCQRPIKREGHSTDRRLYCSEECSKKGNSIRQIEKRKNCNLQARLGLKPGAIGEINEKIVSIDLIKRGFKVYTAFEPTHPFDILAMKGERIIKVEVKTETVLPSGLGRVSMKKTQGHGKTFDVLAKVRNLSDITYEPEIEA